MADVKYTDMMVDTETTGVNPHVNGIIQLSAIPFNIETREVGRGFDRMPGLLPFRSWDESTRIFWRVTNKEVYHSIVAKQECPIKVYNDFFNWVRSITPEGGEGIRFWAMPSTFDWNFVVSHLEQCNIPMPFHYRYVRDMNSFVAGLSGDARHPTVGNEVPFPAGGKGHYALHDCAWQLDQLFHALDKAKAGSS